MFDISWGSGLGVRGIRYRTGPFDIGLILLATRFHQQHVAFAQRLVFFTEETWLANVIEGQADFLIITIIIGDQDVYFSDSNMCRLDDAAFMAFNVNWIVQWSGIASKPGLGVYVMEGCY